MLKNWINQNFGLVLIAVWFSWCWFGINLMIANNTTTPEGVLFAVSGFLVAITTVAWAVQKVNRKRQDALTKHLVTFVNGPTQRNFIILGCPLTGYIVKSEDGAVYGEYPASDFQTAIGVSFDLVKVQEKATPSTWIILRILRISNNEQQYTHFELYGLTQKSFSERLAERAFQLRRTPCMVLFPTELTAQVCDVFGTITNFVALTARHRFGMINITLDDDLLPTKMLKLHERIETQVTDEEVKRKRIVFFFFVEAQSKLVPLVFHGSADSGKPEDLSTIGKETWITQIQLVRNAQ